MEAAYQALCVPPSRSAISLPPPTENYTVFVVLNAKENKSYVGITSRNVDDTFRDFVLADAAAKPPRTSHGYSLAAVRTAPLEFRALHTTTLPVAIDLQATIHRVNRLSPDAFGYNISIGYSESDDANTEAPQEIMRGWKSTLGDIEFQQFALQNQAEFVDALGNGTLVQAIPGAFEYFLRHRTRFSECVAYDSYAKKVRVYDKPRVMRSLNKTEFAVEAIQWIGMQVQSIVWAALSQENTPEHKSVLDTFNTEALTKTEYGSHLHITCRLIDERRFLLLQCRPSCSEYGKLLRGYAEIKRAIMATVAADPLAPRKLGQLEEVEHLQAGETLLAKMARRQRECKRMQKEERKAQRQRGDNL